MKTYVQNFVNHKYNNWASLTFMAEFIYNKEKNISIGYIAYDLNQGYHSCVFYQEDMNHHSK